MHEMSVTESIVKTAGREGVSRVHRVSVDVGAPLAERFGAWPERGGYHVRMTTGDEMRVRDLGRVTRAFTRALRSLSTASNAMPVADDGRRSQRAGTAAALGLAAWVLSSPADADAFNTAARACPDVRIPLDVSIGFTPVASLTVGGARGWFLINSGSTSSAVDATSYGIAEGATAELGYALCGPAMAVFRAWDMRSYRAPEGGQRGRIGTDILAGLAVTFSYGDPSPAMTVQAGRLDPAVLAAAGYTEVGRPGYYGAKARDRFPGSTDVPVIGLAIGPVAAPAQLDTGFDDDRDPGIVQGNAALLAALRAHGVAMHPVPARSTRGCDGPRPYPRWQVDSAALSVIATDGAPAKTYPPPLLEIKDDVSCGGIAAFSEPFAQIGASWLGRWRTTILDGPGGRVWLLR